jgi:hypothetical protein
MMTTTALRGAVRDVILAGAMIVALAAPVRADVLQVSNFFLLPIAAGGSNPTQSTLFSIPRFDPALGALDGIEFDLVRGVLNFSWAVDNESAFSSVLTDASAAARTRLAWLGGELAEFVQAVTFGPPFEAVAADTDADANFIGSDSHTFFGAFPLLAQTVAIADPAVLAAFVGVGSVLLEERARFLPSSPGPGIFFHDATLAQSTGGVVWRYQYTPLQPPPPPPAVPEPGTVALIVTGTALAVLRRRGSSSVEPAFRPDRN